MASARHLGLSCFLLCLAGCSLVFGTDQYRGGPGAGGEDAGADAAADGAPAGCTGDKDCVPVPSFVGETHWGLLYADDTKDLTAAADETWHFDTDTGEVTNGDVVVRNAAATQSGVDAESGIGFSVVNQTGGAPKLGVFFVKSWTVANTAVVNVTGDRGFVLLASDEIVINGTVDAGARGGEGGPGGRDGIASLAQDADRTDQDGAKGVITPQQNSGGGGGGGNGAAGGVGGAGRSFADGFKPKQAGGAPGAASTEVERLQGGGGGGVGQGCLAKINGDCLSGNERFRSGGGGGGAVQLVSATGIRIGPTGTVAVPGEGGVALVDENALIVGSGAGGGAGGTVVLEAPSVEVKGKVTANGGGGGGADDNTGARPTMAARGSVDDDDRAMPAPPADDLDSETMSPGGGGAGGAGAMGTQPGMKGTDAGNDAAGGGGGGGVGRIVIHSDSALVVGASVLFSPGRATKAFLEGDLLRGRVSP